MSKNAFVKRASYRSSALLSVAALATTGLVATALPAGAAITAGADDATTGQPAYYVDSQGLALQLCLDACLEVPEEGEETDPEAPTAADPNHAPYFTAEAVAGVFTVAYEVGTDAEVEGEAGAVVNAAGVGARGVTPGAAYTVKGPWGSFRVRADDRGRVQADVPNAVKGFLRHPNKSGDLLGLPEEGTGPVVGSPTGFNRVTVTGPGVNASTNQFMLVGQLLDDTAMSSASRDSLKLGSVRTAANSTKSIRLDSFGTAPLDVTWRKGGANPGAFTVRSVNLAGGDKGINVTYNPRANRDKSAVLTINDGGLGTPERVRLTGVAHDTLAPKVSQRTPGKGDTVRSGKSVKVTFAEAVRGVKGSTFMLVDASGDKVRASVDRVRRSNKYVLNPQGRLDRDSRYSVKLNGGRKAIRDLAGNAAKDMAWRFRTS